MAANAPLEVASGNPCCLAWQGKYIGMKKRRDAFKEAVTLLQKAIENAHAEKSHLEKKLGEMAAERESKENDSAVKESLEKEVSDLKSEIWSLRQSMEQKLREKNEEVKILQNQASSREKEINELKDLLNKKTLRTDYAEEDIEKDFKELNKTEALLVKDEEIKPHVPEAREDISLVTNLLASERQKTESEKKKADMYFSELEVLRSTAHKTSSDLRTLTSSLETIKKQLELEKQKTLKERKRGDMESAKAREQMKLAEGLSKKFETIRARNEELKKEMELQTTNSKAKFAENSAKLEEKIKLLETHKKKAMEWKSCADGLTQQLQEAQLVTEGLKKQVYELTLSQKSSKSNSVSSNKVRDVEKAEMRLMKKEVKFERKCAKHIKKVAKFEKLQKEFLAEELYRLKQDFGSFTNRILRDIEGTAGLGKAKACKKLKMLPSQKNCNSKKHSDATCHLVASSGSQEQARKLSAQLIPKSGQGVSESVSGTISQLDSPTGGSRKLQSSGVVSSATSFSDGQLLASQGRGHVYVPTSAKIAKEIPNIQPKKSSVPRKISENRNNEKPCLVPEDCHQSRQRDSQVVVNGHSRKRKSILEIVEPHKHLSSGDKKENLQVREKIGTLQSKAVGTGYRPLEKEQTFVSVHQSGSPVNCNTLSKRRRVSCEKKTVMQNPLELNQPGKSPDKITGSTQMFGKTIVAGKVHDATTLSLEDVIATDCMKLLELENLEEENYYKMARESLLSPDLPQVDFLADEIVNEDRNPASALDLVASNSMDICETIRSSKPPSLNTQNDSAAAKMPTMSTTLHDHIPKHFVVFSNIEDQNIIIKIFHASNNCIKRCPSVTKGEWDVPAILLSVKMEENLLGRERVCVFLSVMLHNFSVVSSLKTGDTQNVDSFSCLDSFKSHVHGVIDEIGAGGMLSEFSEELLSLLQDLLYEQRVLFFVKSSETSESDISIPVTLNGDSIALVSRIALVDHLVAGSAILAAICNALDRIGFIFEASFEILHKHREKTSVILTLLHVFAYIAGEKMVSSSEHDVSAAVLKSIVVFLENKHSIAAEGIAKLHPGENKCPFSDRASSLEAVASMLMGVLQEFTTLHQSLTRSLGSSHLEKTEFRPTQKDFQCELKRDQSATLCNLCDILSLLEIITSYTAWDWTSANILGPLLKMLEMPLPMNLSVAIVSLLGQLCSIGVDAVGYKNEGISNVREKLSSFLQCETTLKAGFAVQITTVSSVLKTLQPDIPITFQGKATMLPDSVDQSISSSVNLVNKWFSLLSDEQRVFTSEFFHTSIV